jgi:eukaryotic-like serine/threonine-protein kinase
MQEESIALIRGSYAQIAARLEGVVARFYELLFQREPGLRVMFPADMSRQREHLATAIAIVGRNIADLEALEGPLAEMGARHHSYGTRPEHYILVREALLEAMAGAMQELWTPRHTAAWREALNTVSVAMLKGAAAVDTQAKAG